LGEWYVGVYSHLQMMNYPKHGQILYYCCCLNTFKLIQGSNLKMLLIPLRTMIAKKIANHINWSAMVILISHSKPEYAFLLIITYRLCHIPKSMEVWRILDKRMIHELM
jgi:hypothetical protein